MQKYFNFYLFSGFNIPKCSYVLSVTTLPLAVLFRYPCCNKYGSYTSSIVDTSSPIEDANASIPTGPPLNFSIIDNSKF